MSLQIYILTIVLASLLSSSSQTSTLNNGASLSAPQDFLTSAPYGNFTAGFYPVGHNAYCFAIWFTQPLTDGNLTVVWMANRDRPVNGVKSKLSLLKSGNLVLNDAGQTDVWSTQTHSDSPVELQLYDNGNLVLHAVQDQTTTLWQSFDSPTDTLLPQQPITGASKLVSARSLSNCSSGFYQLLFDADNVLRLLYDGFGITTVFWPSPWLRAWDAGRTTYNSSKIAFLDPLGHFTSSDGFQFNTIDNGESMPRIMRLDSDGGLRVYSLDKTYKIWNVTWQASSEPCATHGICGLNSLCNYIDHSGTRKCSCLPGHRAKNKTDWAYGCEPEFNLSCDGSNLQDFADFKFVELNHVELFGYDLGSYVNKTIDECKQMCLTDCRCRGFQYNLNSDNGQNRCYPKALLFNGYRSPSFQNPTYIKVSQKVASLNDVSSDLQCKRSHVVVLGTYDRNKEHKTWLKSFIWFSCAAGVFEILCLITYWIKTRKHSDEAMQGYQKIADRFQKFSYAELKKATHGFSEEIGRGGSGVVYKGKLADNRVAAIKRLHEASHHQGEEEFLAEMSTIGKLNHMNLIEIWGYCAEGKHRLLVYEYMENGSLGKNLCANKLDWETRYEIAVGTAKGLAYLHEECLEWVLHCDVKPQNILLDSDFNPKVIDFGLSKLLKRGANNGSQFSKIRGTRGYMAPEWVYNLPITCKVDVYSYGIVLLELITGKSPLGFHGEEDQNNMVEQGVLVTWVREKMNSRCETAEWVEEIVDRGLNGKYDLKRMEILVNVALKCSEEDRDARPTMSQVVHMLLPETQN